MANPDKPIKHLIVEGRSGENGEFYDPSSGGRKLRGGVMYQFSEMRFIPGNPANSPGLEDGACHRLDVANFLDSWIVDIGEAYRLLRRGDTTGFEKAMMIVRETMLRELMRITTPEERLILKSGKTIEDIMAGAMRHNWRKPDGD